MKQEESLEASPPWRRVWWTRRPRKASPLGKNPGSAGSLHYHFGSKGGLIIALFSEENARLLARQTEMYAQDTPLWRRYEQACDFLEDDLESGYVRVLQELVAAGWSNPEIGTAVRELLGGWIALLVEVAREAERRHGGLGPFTAEELATLIGSAFIGAEALLLLGFEREALPIRSALRRIGVLIREREEGTDPPAGRQAPPRPPADAPVVAG